MIPAVQVVILLRGPRLFDRNGVLPLVTLPRALSTLGRRSLSRPLEDRALGLAAVGCVSLRQE